MPAPRRSLNPFRALQIHRNFRLFWTGQTVSLIGTWMQQVGQGWLALELTDSAFFVGLVAAAGTLPVLLFSLYGGVVADRRSKLQIVMVCQALLLLEAAALCFIVVLLVRGRRRLAGYVAVSVLGAQLVSISVKVIVERVRPCVDLASCPDTTSFPSGHAVGAAAFWITAAILMLPVVGRRAWALLAVPPLVALTRVLLGVHYPSDVLAGLLVGGCWAAACTAVLTGWREERVGHDVPLEEVAEGVLSDHPGSG